MRSHGVVSPPMTMSASNASARVRERDAAEQQVRAPLRGIGVTVELRHDAMPGLTLEERHLASPAAIDVAREPSALDELRFFDGIHHAAMRALDPDGVEMPGSRMTMGHVHWLLGSRGQESGVRDQGVSG